MRSVPADLTAAIMIRDGALCAMCGQAAQYANHRADRGMGGFKAGDRPSNLCAICWACNGLIEADADYAAEARRRGVKISRYDNPETVRYLSPLLRIFILLRDDWTWETADAAGPEPAASNVITSTKGGYSVMTDTIAHTGDTP